MERSVIFETGGKIDLRALTVFGLNVKPYSHPIGYFGTGLKYAVAVLSRHQIPITIWVGPQKWTVQQTESDFRGKQFNELSLIRHRKVLGPKGIRLPFTTELGKNWDLWQAFRELHANTLDEQGNTYIDDDNQNDFGKNTTTKIIVHSELFVQEFFERNKTFLSDGYGVQTDDPIQVLDRPSQFVYYRGIRILDLKNPSRYTYNILEPVTLTEDRTAKDEWEIKHFIARHVIKSDNADFIKDVITAKDTYEKDISYEYTYVEPSQVFLDTVESAPSTYRSRSAYKYMRSYRPLPPKPKLPSQVEFLEQIAERLEYSMFVASSIQSIIKEIRERITALKDEAKETVDEDVI